MGEGPDIELAFTGNAYLQNRISVYNDAPFLRFAELLRSADASFANLECAIQDGEDFPAYVAGNGRGATYMRAAPWMLDELKWAGIRMVYAANNHCADFAEGGILSSIRYLRAAGMAYAGIGSSLSAATAPGYLETPKGRIAMISVADWGPRGIADLPYQMPSAVMPGDGGPYYKSRPGVNLLRYDAVTLVDRSTLDALRRASSELDWERAKAARRNGGGRAEPFVGPKLLGGELDSETEFHFMGRKFVLSDTFDFRTEPFEDDLERNYRAVREARLQADIVVVAFHGQGIRRPVTEAHSSIFAHGAIEAGADVYLDHGGTYSGYEIYKGKPVLYGVGPFMLQNEQVQQVPYEMMVRWGLTYEQGAADFVKARQVGEGHAGGASVALRGEHFRTQLRGGPIPVVVFDKDRNFKEVRIYIVEPLSAPNTQRGRPQMATAASDAAAAVLRQLVETSNEQYHTKVEVADGVGFIRASSQ